MPRNKVAIWVPSRKSQGLGHYYRNIWIVEKLKESAFFFNEVIEYSVDDTSEIFINSDPEQIENYLISQKYTTLFIDHYFLSSEIQNYFINKRKLKVVYFDQDFSAPRFDALVNSNPFAFKELYLKAPTDSTLFLGVDYFGFRNEFYKISDQKKHLNTVLISFGGSDVLMNTLAILPRLSSKFTYNICLGRGCSPEYVNSVKESFGKLELKGEVHYDSSQYLEFLATSSAAIITSSTSVYEAEFFNVPYIAFKVVENQNRLADFLNKNGISVWGNINDFQMSDTGTEFKKLGLKFGTKCNEFLSFLEAN